ncbi:hypothetical protein DES34_10834 [Brevibacillus brevis]|nr:hypothetical protein C7J99_10315 [Brevibacillus brevis]RED28173.1 hypothetical protein DES34_10834 [Brevibacillus brevis]VEF90869.1 Uncharacterised protein [Brevibacillus brevis]
MYLIQFESQYLFIIILNKDFQPRYKKSPPPSRADLITLQLPIILPKLVSLQILKLLIVILLTSINRHHSSDIHNFILRYFLDMEKHPLICIILQFRIHPISLTKQVNQDKVPLTLERTKAKKQESTKVRK